MKGRGGALKGVTGVGGENDVVSRAASGDGGTGMLDGTAMVMENWKSPNMSFRCSTFYLIP